MINLSEVKELLQITNNDNDDLINSLITKNEDAIIRYCKNHFLQYEYDYFMSTNISFDGNNNTINFTGIENQNLSSGDYLRVYGSLKNDGVYLIDSVNTGFITINSLRSLKTEDLNKSIIICLVDYPEDLKISISQMIGYRLENFTPGLLSEKIDDYSYSLNSQVLINGIPSSIAGDLASHRHAYIHDIFSMHNLSRWC